MFYVSTSTIKNAGLGAFTSKEIKKGTYLDEYDGLVLNEEDIKRSKYYFQTHIRNKSVIIDGQESNNWTKYMNCSFNTQSDNVVAFSFNGKVFFFAKRDIKENEELMFYYGDPYAESLNINKFELSPVKITFSQYKIMIKLSNCGFVSFIYELIYHN